jgi:hypothetical protein
VEHTSTQTTLAIFPPTTEGGEEIQAICKIGQGGQWRSLRTRLRLSEKKGEIFSLSTYTKVDGEWKTVKNHAITAAGYDHINQFVGVSFISPDTLRHIDGKDVPNPFVERDEKSGEIVAVRVRRIGIGRVASGNMTARDLTVTFDLRTYLAQDFWSKWTGRKKDAPKAWGVLMPNQAIDRGSAMQEGPFGVNSCAYPMPAGVTLIVDLSNKDVLAVLGEHITRQKFAERNAVTICDRNILKKMFGVAKLDESLTVPVVGWIQDDHDMAKLGAIVADASEGRVVPPGAEHLAIDVERAAEVVDDLDEVQAALAGDADEDMVQPEDTEDAPTPAVDPAPSAPTVDPKVKAMRQKVRDICEQLPNDKVHSALGAVGIEGTKDICNCGAEVLDAAVEALEAEVLEKKNAELKAKQKRTARGTARGKTEQPPLLNDGEQSNFLKGE